MVPEEPQVLEIVENDEISINYVMNHIIWNQNEVNIDESFTYNIAMNATNDNDDQLAMIIEDCRWRKDWPKWKYAKKHNCICLLNERFLDV